MRPLTTVMAGRYYGGGPYYYGRYGYRSVVPHFRGHPMASWDSRSETVLKEVRPVAPAADGVFHLHLISRTPLYRSLGIGAVAIKHCNLRRPYRREVAARIKMNPQRQVGLLAHARQRSSHGRG